MRALFACAVIWPNDELPNAALAGAAHCTRLVRFSTSSRSESDVVPPVCTFFATDRSTLLRIGDMMPGRMRGPLPNVFAADVENAAGFRNKLLVVLVRMRSVISPGTRNGWPGTMFGRAMPP